MLLISDYCRYICESQFQKVGEFARACAASQKPLKKLKSFGNLQIPHFASKNNRQKENFKKMLGFKNGQIGF